MTPNFTMKGGNIVNKNGTGHQSIYGGVFQDEGVWIRHTEQGLLSMVNSGPNTNGSQFYVTFEPCPDMDGKNTVFGRVISGYSEICEKVWNNPSEEIKILDCGEMKEKLSD